MSNMYGWEDEMKQRSHKGKTKKILPKGNGKNKLKAYLSGRMSGLEDHGFQSFADATKVLHSRGIEVLSPSENFNGAIVDALRSLYMRKDIQQVLRADMIVVIPGWIESPGAMLEVAVAREIGIPVLNLEDMSLASEVVTLRAVNLSAMSAV